MKKDIKRMTLAQIRKKQRMTQKDVAERMLSMTRKKVSELEHSTDPPISLVIQYVKAIGGNLEFVILFDNEDSEILKRE